MGRGGITTAASTLHGPAATLGLWYGGGAGKKCAKGKNLIII